MLLTRQLKMTSSVMIMVIQAFGYSYTSLDFLHNGLVYGSGESLNQRHRTHRHSMLDEVGKWKQAVKMAEMWRGGGGGLAN